MRKVLNAGREGDTTAWDYMARKGSVGSSDMDREKTAEEVQTLELTIWYSDSNCRSHGIYEEY